MKIGDVIVIRIPKQQGDNFECLGPYDEANDYISDEHALFKGVVTRSDGEDFSYKLTDRIKINSYKVAA